MKKIGYLLFALFFNLSRIRSVQSRKVVLYNGQYKGLCGNLLEMKRELEERKTDVKIYYFSKAEMLSARGLKKLRGIFSFFVLCAYHMATAGQVFFNDNFFPLQYCRPSKEAQLVQLWHGVGAFKMFGLSTERDRKVKGEVQRVNSRITHLFVTSKQIIPFYEWAFAIPRNKIYATGVPVTDLYFDEERMREGRAHFYETYPFLTERKLLLITPTIRNTEKENRAMLDNLPLEQMYELLGERWVFLLRLHPKVQKEKLPPYSYCINVTEYPEISELFLVSDLLIADYSSTVVEYALLGKPIILYAYDLLRYDRGFYREYRENIPGVLAETQGELLNALEHPQDTGEKRERFLKQQYDFTDGRSLERIWRVLEETKLSERR